MNLLRIGQLRILAINGGPQLALLIHSWSMMLRVLCPVCWPVWLWPPVPAYECVATMATSLLFYNKKKLMVYTRTHADWEGRVVVAERLRMRIRAERS